MKVTVEFKMINYTTEEERDLNENEQEIIWELLEEHLDELMDEMVEKIELKEEDPTWVFA